MQKAIKKICGRCGSSNLISDRSLGGKIICVKCGSSNIKIKGFLNSSNKKFYYVLFILFVIFLIVII